MKGSSVRERLCFGSHTPPSLPFSLPPPAPRPSVLLQFDPLQPGQLREVARLMTAELNQRLKVRGT